MKRIVVLSRRDITHPLSGGAGKYMHEILRRLTDRYSIIVLAEGGPKSAPIEEIDGIDYRHFSRGPNRLLLPARYMINFARETDLLIDNADVAIPWLTPFYSRVPRIVVVYQIAGDIFRHELAWPLSELAIQLEPSIYSIYKDSNIVTCSPSTKEDLVRIGLPAENVSVVVPGIDESFRKFEPDGHKFEDPTIVCISRFRRYKGLDYAIDSMKYVLERNPKARLIIVGNGDEKEVKDRVMSTDYADSIQILKRSPNKWNDEKKILLSKAHLLLIPSVREGYGIVVIEANACGTPAIGWSVAGVRDSIVQDQTGLLVPFGDTRALGDAITKYLGAGSPEWLSLPRNALQWARQHSWEKAAKEFEGTIETVLSKS